jgi:hypothetical protein
VTIIDIDNPMINLYDSKINKRDMDDVINIMKSLRKIIYQIDDDNSISIIVKLYED